MNDPFDGYETLNFRGWDSYDAKPITPETIAIARAVADLLRGQPDIAPGADGMIGFEWVDNAKDHRIFLDVDANHFTIYGQIGDKVLQVPRAEPPTSPTGSTEKA